MSKREYAALAGLFEMKLAGGQTDVKGAFSGYGSVFGNPHPTSSWQLPPDWKDVIEPGAFEKSLAEHKANGTAPVMFLQHDHFSLPIGAWTSVAEDAKGLRVEGQLADTDEGNKVYQLMKMKALSGLSVGFDTVKQTLDEESKTRHLLEVKLYEISPVAMAGNPKARVEEVKGQGECECPCPECQDGDCENCSCDGCASCDAGDCPGCPEEEAAGCGGGEKPAGEGKSHRHPNAKRLEVALRGAGLSRSEAKAVLAGGMARLDMSREEGALLAAMAALTDAMSGR